MSVQSAIATSAIPTTIASGTVIRKEHTRQLAFELLVLTITIGTILFSAASQTIRHMTTVQGVQLIWPLIGGLFAAIKLALAKEMIAAIAEPVGGDAYKREYRGVMSNRLTAGLLVCTNIVLLSSLLLHGVALWHWTLLFTLPVWAFTGIWWYMNRERSVQRKLLVLGTGINIIPTYFQGLAYILLGSKGMPWFNMVVLLVMGVGLYIIAYPKGRSSLRRRAEIRQGKHPLFQLARRDLCAQLMMGACCFAAPHLTQGWPQMLWSWALAQM